MIVVGHRESSVPFSYYDNQQKVVGYSQDYSNAIVEAVKKKLNKPDLQVKLIPITSQNRIPLLQNGTFDFECGSTTNNKGLSAYAVKVIPESKYIYIAGERLKLTSTKTSSPANCNNSSSAMSALPLEVSSALGTEELYNCNRRTPDAS